MKFLTPIPIAAGNFVSSSVTEDDYAEWFDATTYAAAAHVISTTTHRIYESVQAGNFNHNPTTDDGTWWVDIGPTNRWAMFDQAVGSLTTDTSAIVVAVEPAEPFSALTLLDLVAQTVQVEVVVDAVTIFDTTYPMEDRRLCTGLWDYFFLPLDRQSDLVVTDLPPTGEVTVTIDGGTDSACGTFAIGRLTDIGTTLTNPQIGISSYSVKATDAYGVTTITARGYSKTFDVDVLLDSRRTDGVARALAATKDTAVVWLGDDELVYSSLLAYGFFKDWGVVIKGPVKSSCRLTIEGLST